jgi:hypothetical protein
MHVRNNSRCVVSGAVVIEENRFHLGARRYYKMTVRIQYLINYGIYPLYPPINLEALSCDFQSFQYTITICVTAASIFTFSGMVPTVSRIFSLLQSVGGILNDSSIILLYGYGKKS